MHVQCTRKWFAHLKIRTHLQVKREAPLIPNLQGTCILCLLKIHWGATSVGCRLHAPGAENFFDEGSFGFRKLRPRETKIGTWVHLGKAYLAPYEVTGWGALCTCGACVNILHLLLFCPVGAQARRYAPLMANMQVTCMLPQPICFVVTIRVRCRLRAPVGEKFI